jgi:UTP--glucose-1-phosphate uridylyltransferase
MSSFATQGPIRAAIAHDQTRQPVAEFCQNSSLRLTPTGELFLLDGAVSPYSTGHGDLPECLQKSGLLRDFIASGGKTVWIANIDNIGAGIDPAILGFHLRAGAPLSVELVAKRADDRGGIPVRRASRLEILEEFRLPLAFDARSVPVFNTNTFLVDALALETLRLDWTYFQVQKTVHGQPIVQFERLLGELTSAISCNYLQVARTGIHGRFLPVKNDDELRLRRDEILEIASHREILARD